MSKKISFKTLVPAVLFTMLLAETLINILPTSLPTMAANGEWRPNSVGVFPHSLGISRSNTDDNSAGLGVTNPSTIGASTSLRRITLDDLNGTNGRTQVKFDCSMDSDNQLSTMTNSYAFPDGIAYSSFNNYRNEFIGGTDNNVPGPNLFFGGSSDTEQERNYLKGRIYNNPTTPNEQPTIRENITLSPSDISNEEDVRLLAYVHNNGSTSLNPTGGTLVDPRASGPNYPVNLSTVAQNTRTHFSVPGLAVPDGEALKVTNRLRADNSYHVSNAPVNCNELSAAQVSDTVDITNDSNEPLTFVARRGFINNPYNTTNTNFPTGTLPSLVDPTITVADPLNPIGLNGDAGARVSSGRSENSADWNQSDNDNNRRGNPRTLGSQFDGEWFGSRDFTRYIGLDLDAVAAEPELSVNKSVRRSDPSPEAFTTSGPTSTTTSGSSVIEYRIMLQNSGNVDLDNINLADQLPSELAPANLGNFQILGRVSICADLATANSSSSCTIIRGLSVPMNSLNQVTLTSAELGISATRPLHRDPNFITTGSGSNGEVLRVRFFMTATCSPNEDGQIAENYAMIGAWSNGVNANIVSTSDTDFPQYSGSTFVTEQQWRDLFVNVNQIPGTTNNTQVAVNACQGDTALRIGKYVRRISPTSSETFGTGSTFTEITGVGTGQVEYAVLLENSDDHDLQDFLFADRLPSELSLDTSSIRTEICNNITDARATANCPSATVHTVSASAYNSSTRILSINQDDMGEPTVSNSNPLETGQVIRIRWTMNSVCVPYGSTRPEANNYALVYANEVSNVTRFSGLTNPDTPYNIDNITFNDLFPEDSPGLGGIVTPFATNNTVVRVNNCTPPPPSVEKAVSTTARGTGSNPTTFLMASSPSSAVDFGARSSEYRVHYRVQVSNTSEEATLTSFRLQDRFYYRNGSTVSAQDIVQSIGTRLDTRTVGSGNAETVIGDPARKVVYTSSSSGNVLTFTVPALLPGETLAFYYDIDLDPGVRSATQLHRNEVQVCFDEDGPNDADECTGDDARVFHQDIPQNNPLTLQIIKRVNGHDANQASLTATGDQAAVQVSNGGALTYSVLVTAPSSNTAPVTNIVLSDNVGGLANVTNVTNVRLITTGSICTTICTLPGGIADLGLSSRRFTLDPGDTATLTYDAVAAYTNGTTFAQNTATATPDSGNEANPDPVTDPATIIVVRDGITVQKTVNGEDANTDQTAVTVNSDATLNYVVIVRAATNNVGPVTGAVIADNVTTLPNITNIRNITLQTPGAPCLSICTLTSMSQLSTYSFNLALGQSATLRYTATGVNTTTTTSARNLNRVTVTTANTGPADDVAIVFVRGQDDEDEPETNFRIIKDADPSITRHGDEVTYTIRVEPTSSRNDEIEDLTLLITDDINDDGTLQQGGVTFTYIRNSTRIRTDGADCEGEMDDDEGIRCENVSADEEIRITYRVRVSAPNLDAGDIVVVENTARLRSDTPGVRIRDDDDAEVQVIATERPDLPPPPEQFLQITKNVNQREVRRGETVTYTIQVHNPNAQDVIRTLVDTIGLNGGTVPGQNGGRVRFVEGTLQLSGAQYSGSIANPAGMVLIIPALGTATITYNATGETEPNQRVVSLAPNTATLNTGEYATAFVELPKTGPAAIAVTAFTSLLASGTYFITRRKKK